MHIRQLGRVRRAGASRDHQQSASLSPPDHAGQSPFRTSQRLGDYDRMGSRLQLLHTPPKSNRVSDVEIANGGTLKMVSSLSRFHQGHCAPRFEQRDGKARKAGTRTKIRETRGGGQRLKQSRRLEDQALDDGLLGPMTGQIHAARPAFEQPSQFQQGFEPIGADLEL